MGQKKLLAKQLKQDANKVLKYIKEKVEDKDLGYYFSSRYAKRNFSKAKKELKKINLAKTFSQKNVRKRIELFKQNYLSSIDATYSLSPTNIKRKFKYFKKYHPNFVPNIEKSAVLASGVVISYTFLLYVDKMSLDFSDIKNFLAEKKEKQEYFEKKVDEREKQNIIAKIEENKKEYKENKKESQEKHQENKRDFHSITDIFAVNKLTDNIGFMPIEQEGSVEERVNRRYQTIEGGKPKLQISLKDLLEKGGVNIYDLQIAIDQNPSILQKMEVGLTNKKLALSADNVTKTFRPRGQCLEGVQKIFDNANYPNIISRGAPNWPQRIKGCRANSACNAYIPLEKNGNYVVVSIENKAYQKSKGSVENKLMREFAKKLSPGTIVITDNVIADQYKSHSYKDLRNIYGKGGKLHGHIAVIDNSRYFKSDGCEPNGPDFSRYGKVIRIPLPRDIYIPKEQALEILQVAEVSKQEKSKIIGQNILWYDGFFKNKMDRI